MSEDCQLYVATGWISLGLTDLASRSAASVLNSVLAAEIEVHKVAVNVASRVRHPVSVKEPQAGIAVIGEILFRADPALLRAAQMHHCIRIHCAEEGEETPSAFQRETPVAVLEVFIGREIYETLGQVGCPQARSMPRISS